MDEKTKKIYKELYEDYHLSLPDKIAAIEKSMGDLKRERSEEVYQNQIRLIHSMRGSAGSYGHHFLTSLCQRWEELLAGYAPFSGNVDAILGLGEKGLGLIKKYHSDIDSCKEELLVDFV